MRGINVLSKFAAESDTFYIDCADVLAADETIAGEPIMTQLPDDLTGSDALQFGVPDVVSVPVLFPDGRSARASTVVAVRISNGTPVDADSEREYTVVVTFATNAGNTKQARGRLLVLPLAL